MKFTFVGIELADTNRIERDALKQYESAIIARRLFEVVFRVETNEGLPHKVVVMLDGSGIEDDNIIRAARAKIDEITEHWTASQGARRFA